MKQLPPEGFQDMSFFEDFTIHQHTLAKDVRLSGIGTHTGKTVHVTMKPATADSGIQFFRCDLKNQSHGIPAHIDSVSDTRLCTTISNGSGASLQTIEHLMAALYACQVDNAQIYVNGPEMPIMDGSAEPFIREIDRVGLIKQDAYRKFIYITQDHIYRDGDCSLEITPSDTLLIDYDLPMTQAPEFQQGARFQGGADTFKAQICQARTFGFLEDGLKLQAAGLARGSSLKNAVVLHQGHVLNPEGMRSKNELACHKILDMVGDLYLMGMPIIGHLSGVKSGHSTNYAFLKSLLESSEKWQVLTIDDALRQKTQKRIHQTYVTGWSHQSVGL